jgi:hypothetical protein
VWKVAHLMLSVHDERQDHEDHNNGQGNEHTDPVGWALALVLEDERTSL